MNKELTLKIAKQFIKSPVGDVDLNDFQAIEDAAREDKMATNEPQQPSMVVGNRSSGKCRLKGEYYVCIPE
jgi:hypothetical protein